MDTILFYLGRAVGGAVLGLIPLITSLVRKCGEIGVKYLIYNIVCTMALALIWSGTLFYSVVALAIPVIMAIKIVKES